MLLYAAAQRGQIASPRYAVPTILSCRPIASMNSVAPWVIVTTRCGLDVSALVTPQLVYDTGWRTD